MDQKDKNLTMLTLNAGLLDVEILGRPVLEPTPFVNERLKILPKALARTNADVIALQEVYEQKHREFLISGLRKIYPHHFYSRQKRFFRLENSLMFFSKYPIAQRTVLPYKHSIWEEEFLIYKGVLIAKIEIPHWGLVSFYNFHTAAGGIRDPQNKKVEEVRGLQITQMLEKIKKDKHKGLKIILGDLNAGPEAAKENYDLFQKFNFTDAIGCCHRKLYSRTTWDPENRLNLGGPHKNCPAQRCDHIFFRESDTKHLLVNRADIILDKQIVKLPSGEKITVSDHCGVLAEISKI